MAYPPVRTEVAVVQADCWRIPAG